MLHINMLCRHGAGTGSSAHSNFARLGVVAVFVSNTVNLQAANFASAGALQPVVAKPVRASTCNSRKKRSGCAIAGNPACVHEHNIVHMYRRQSIA